MAMITAETTGNVIPMTAPIFDADKRPTTKRTMPVDHKLIERCGEYLAYMKGANALYEADASGENCVERLDGEFRSKGEALLKGIAQKKAKSLSGLRAKAAVLKFIASEIPLYCATAHDATIMNSIADDIFRFQKAAQVTGTADDPIKETGR